VAPQAIAVTKQAYEPTYSSDQQSNFKTSEGNRERTAEFIPLLLFPSEAEG